MRVLWFTNTSSGYNSGKEAHNYYGAGWISSLEEVLSRTPGMEMAVAFFHPTDNTKAKQGNITYYPIKRKNNSYLRQFVNNWTTKMETETDTLRYMEVVNDFKPDIIQVFGTEGHFATVQSKTNVPVVIHIQGFINACLHAWYPPGISSRDVLLHGSTLKSTLKANSKWFGRRQFEKRGLREKQYFPQVQYVMGRTAWVNGVTALLMPQAEYFEVNEVLRPAFYSARQWTPKQRSTARIVSTISSTTYKGLDQVLKTAAVLKEYGKLPFEWFIAGVSATDPLVKLMEKKFRIRFADHGVSFLGPTPSEKLLELLLDADVYMHPSYIETGCISVAEAQMLGLPVIACYVGGLTSTISQQETGLLVAANDPLGLSVQILNVVNNKEMAARLGSQAREMAAKRHDKTTIVNNILQVYRKMINNASHFTLRTGVKQHPEPVPGHNN